MKKTSMSTQNNIRLYGTLHPVASWHMLKYFHFEMELIHEPLKYQLLSSYLCKMLLLI